MTHTTRRGLLAGVAIVVVIVGLAIAWRRSNPVAPPEQQDEALRASPAREAASFPAADEDYFRDMDQTRNGPVALSADEIRGRNTWIVWSGGNDRLWDMLSETSGGALDFLKVVSSHPSQNYSRSIRWDYFGLVNEPCFTKPTAGDPARWGLWVDQRQADCPSDPFENATKYPGVQTGSRGQTLNGKSFETGSFYGYATGIVGLRLFPNPAFDEAAAKRWDAERYYTEKAYYDDKTLVRPYRVGMSCGFCHVGPNPINPPADPNNPAWANLSSNVGAQYFTIDRIFYQAADFEDFAFQIFHASRPGSLDTSFVPSDNINNPRTMNAMYLLGPRILHAKRWGKETLAGGGRNNHQFNDFIKDGPLATLFVSPETVWAPRVLKDGADSVGALGALNRVYLNIGTFSEQWTQHFMPLVGAKPVTPISVEATRRNSAYFKATEAQTLDVAKFFLKTTDAHHLADAPGGAKYLTTDASVLTRGKEVFADNCARCHSTKLPAMVAGLDSDSCNGKGYLDCWNRYWASTQTPEFKKQMRDIVTAPDFLTDNYLSAEFRVPMTLLQTNACSPLATNATSGNIWDNFSSQSYKELPSVGKMLWYHPITGEPRAFEMPAGGRGYTRPPSLVSLWSTAPFLLNNTVGRLEMSPSVEGRMRSFDDSIHKLLWPQDRDRDSVLGDKVPGLMDRVGDRAPEGHGSQPVYLKFSAAYLPEPLKRTLRTQQALFPSLFSEDGLRIGPIPRGTPIGLLSNLRLLADDPSKQVEHDARLGALMVRILARLHKLGPNATDADTREAFLELVDPLLEMSKCPDFVVNRGHLFGSELADAEKRALIEFLKTF